MEQWEAAATHLARAETFLAEAQAAVAALGEEGSDGGTAAASGGGGQRRLAKRRAAAAAAVAKHEAELATWRVKLAGLEEEIVAARAVALAKPKGTAYFAIFR